MLVVEASDPDLESLSLVLSADYHIIRATKGKEALELIEKEDPELVLIGNDLPDMEGYDVCKTIKENVQNTLLPVIVLTSILENEEKADAIKTNADGILIKPVDELELTTRVRSLIRMRHLHEELVKERDRVQRYIDLAGSIIGVVDRDFKVTLVNQKACDVLGYSKEEVLGQNWFDVFVPEYIRDDIKKGYLGVINGTIVPPEFSEKPIITKNKEEKWVLWHDVVLRDDDMNIVGTISSGDDITERKLAENAMEEANKELKLLDNIKDQFLTNLNYELRTPLISIKGFCELLIEEKLGTVNDSQKNALDAVLRNSERLRHLIDSLLYVSGERNQNIKYNIIPLYPARLIEDILEDRALYIEKKELTIESHVPKNLPAILGDIDHLERMFTHLLDNAIKFTPPGGKIIVSASSYDDTVDIKIKDTGIGIPEDLLPNIFSSFYQVDGSTRRKYGGTGVGLHICKKIIEAHMGEIFVESEVGVGTTFIVQLPV
ncbi:hybrid sensor histidine kinase/response regulator [Methanococcoides methylutens]|uniref:hybrid sensor histidine kinase/response regulator n=1 Tax=Methanococcoides methylutens TaxID=2226 RepID=UPI004044B019